MREDRVRAVERKLRQIHQKLFDLQGAAITGLREALDAVSETHDQMAVLFQEVNDLRDAIDDRPEA